MNNPVLVGLVSWALPGIGHVIQGRVQRGIIIAGVIWTMFVIAVISGGAYYPGFEFRDGMLLSLLNIFARWGNALGAVISYTIASVPDPTVAARATFEYGGRYLEVAGLLNYLAMLDAVDIAVGR
jgi:hypothetical protein